MSYDDRNENNRTYRHFRTSLDVGMGFFYVIIGALVLYARYFGTIALSGVYANILGGLMIVYGLYRLYRGLTVIIRNRKDR